MDRSRLSMVYASVSVLLWSTVATAFKLTLSGMDVPSLLFCSTITSALLLCTVTAARKELRSVFRATRRELFLSAILGAINPFLYYLVLFGAYERLPAQVAQPLNYTWPLVLSVLAVPLLGKGLGPRTVASLSLGFIGVLVISTEGRFVAFGGLDPMGFMLALSSAVLWSFYWVLNLKDGREGAPKILLSFVFGSLYISVLCMFTGVRVPNGPSLAGALYIGAVEMGVTFFLWYMALKLSRDPSKMSGLIFMTPFLSLIPIWTLLGEPFHPSALVGLLFIVAGAALGKANSRK